MGNKKQEPIGDYRKIALFILGLALFLVLISPFINLVHGYSCKIKASQDDDLYCKLQYSEKLYYTNVTGNFKKEWVLRSYKADAEAEAQRQAEIENARIEAEKNRICYEAGYEINESFDIMEDYELTCPKLEYINDHFVDNIQKLDGGYIKGDINGFLLWGDIGGQLYNHVVTRISATGQLVQSYNSWVDCAGTHHNVKIDMYNEAEFVMYYVNNCVEESTA